MASSYDALCYHGRRSVDELMGALNAENVAAALVHRQLSLLHLEQFVATMNSAADEIPADRLSTNGLTDGIDGAD